MSGEKLVDQFKRGLQKGVEQARRTAEMVEAEARIASLQRKVGMRVYLLWQSGQLSHPDLEEDLKHIAEYEARVESSQDGLENTASTRVSAGGGRLCQSCGHNLASGARFCTGCGAAAPPE